MLNLLFKRFGVGIYISHTDVLRSLNRTMRRANIAVNYSKGFNRHMSLKLTQPLPLGIATNDEWVTIDVATDISCQEFLKKFNDNCPPCLRGVKVVYTDKNPSISASVTASGYVIKSTEAIKYKAEIENLKNSFTVSYDKKGERIVKEVSDCIYGIKVDEEGIRCVLAFGNKNLRVDVFYKQLNENFGLNISNEDVVRQKQFVSTTDGFITVDKYLERVR